MLSSLKYAVRTATTKDLPTIHGLIQTSFAALHDYVSPEMVPRLEGWAKSLCETELSEAQFEKVYFSSYGTTFLVVEDTELKTVHGCVAVKRLSQDMAELVRMSVSPEIRSQGLGGLLINRLVEHCQETGVLQIMLTTGNPRSGQFYAKNGFVNINSPDNRGMRMFRYLGERLMTNVCVIGGTHGNERLGVELVNQWLADPSRLRGDRTSFEVKAMIGNERAVEKNIRYISKDLNRQFLGKQMEIKVEKEEVYVEEYQRACDLDRLLGHPHSLEQHSDTLIPPHSHLLTPPLLLLTGPKGRIVDDIHVDSKDTTTIAPTCDFIIDLHSSNSAVGLVAMISAADYDCVATRLAHHLLSDETMQNKFPGLKVTSSVGDKGQSWSIDSITPYGISFEVGPLTHGTLNSPLLEKTRDLVFATLDFIEQQNQKLIAAAAKGKGITKYLSRSVVLASASAEAEALICRPGDTPTYDCHVQVGKMEYPLEFPTSAATEPTEKTTAKETHNQPFILHPAMEGRDWDTESVLEGVPTFISTDGSQIIVPFKRPVIPWKDFGPATGPNNTDACTLYPLFINEAAYQESNVAFALYKKVSKQLF